MCTHGDLSYPVSKCRLRTSDSLENIISASHLRNELGKTSKNSNKMAVNHNPMYLLNNNITTSNSSQGKDRILTSKVSQSSDVPLGKPLTNTPCNKYTLVSLWRGDMRWPSKHTLITEKDKNLEEVCSNVTTVSSRISDLSNVPSMNSTDGNQSDYSMDILNDSNKETSRGGDMKRAMRIRQIGDSKNMCFNSMPIINHNTVRPAKDELRQTSMSPPVADNQNKFDMVMSMNLNTISSIGSDLKDASRTSKITDNRKKYSVERPRPYNNVHSRRSALSYAPKKSQVSQADNQNKDTSFSTMSAGGCGLGQTFTRSSELSDTKNKCSSNVSFNTAFRKQKSPDLRVPKRINCWDIDQRAVRSMTGKTPSASKVKPAIVGPGLTNQATRDVHVEKSTNINVPSLQKTSATFKSNPCATFVVESKSQTQLQTIMPLSWDELTAQTYHLQSNNSSAKHQDTIKPESAKCDELIQRESIPIELSSTQPIIPIRKRKRAINAGSLLVGNKWNSTLNIGHYQLPNVLVPDTQGQQRQTLQSTEQLRDPIKKRGETVSQVSSKPADSHEKEMNRKVQPINNLEPNNSNCKGIIYQTNSDSTTNSAEQKVIKNTDKVTSSRNSVVTQKILITVESVPSKDAETASILKNNGNEEHKPNSINRTHTGIQVTAYPTVREQTPSYNNVVNGQVDHITIKEKKSSYKNNINKELVDHYAEREQIPSSNNIIRPSQGQGKNLYPVDWEPTTRTIHRNNREGKTNYPEEQEQMSSSIRIICRDGQVNYPIVRESTNISISMPGVYRPVEENYYEVQKQHPSSISSIQREGEVNNPTIRKPMPCFFSNIHSEGQINNPTVMEPKPCFFNSTHKEGQINNPIVREPMPCFFNSTHREGQINNPIVREPMPCFFNSTHREGQINNPTAREPMPCFFNSAHREEQINNPTVREPTPCFFNSIHKEGNINFAEEPVSEPTCSSINTMHRTVEKVDPAVREHNSSHDSSFQTEGQGKYSAVKNDSTRVATCRESQENYSGGTEPVHSSINSVHKEVQGDYITVQEQYPMYFGGIYEEQVNSTVERETHPSISSVYKDEPAKNATTMKQSPSSVSRICRAEQITHSTVREQDPSRKLFSKEVHMNETVPSWTSTAESEKYLYSCNYLDYKESTDSSPVQDSNSQQQCYHFESRPILDECKKEYSTTCNVNQKRQQDVQNCGKEQMQEFNNNFGYGHLVSSVYYNALPSTNFTKYCNEKQQQATWKTMDECNEQSRKDKIYNKQSDHESTAIIEPICFKEKNIEFQAQVQEPLKFKGISHDKCSAYDNNNVKYLTPKLLSEINKISFGKKPIRDVQSEAHEQPSVEWKTEGSCEKCSKDEKCVPPKPIAQINQIHVKQKTSRNMQLEVHEQSETKQKTAEQSSKDIIKDGKYVMPFQLASFNELKQTHTEEQCLSANKNEMVKQTSHPMKEYLNSRSGRLLEELSQAKPAPEKHESQKNNKSQEQVQPVELNTQVNTVATQEMNIHNRKTKREEGRGPVARALFQSTATRPVQQYRIKWMTRKENELHEQAMANKLAEANLTKPAKVKRRSRPTNRKSKVSADIYKCSGLQPNKSKTQLQPNKNISESSWHECNTKLKEYNNGHLRCQNREVTPSERVDSKILSIMQHEEHPPADSVCPDHTCTLVHAEGDPNATCKKAAHPNQERASPIMKDVATYCNFKNSHKIVQQLKTEYGNFEALTARLKNITNQVLSEVKLKPAQPKCLDRKIKDLYDYCQMRKLLPLQDVQCSGERRKKSMFSTNIIAEQDESEECNHVNVLGEETELEDLLEMGILGIGCCGLPPSLIHMHGVISTSEADKDGKVLKLHYGDIQYVIEGNTVSQTIIKSRPEESASQTKYPTPVTIPSENLWQKIKELYDCSNNLHTPESTSKTTMHSDTVCTTQSTESTNISGFDYKGVPDDSLAQLEMKCDGITEHNENTDLGQEYNGTTNQNEKQDCNVKCIGNVSASMEYQYFSKSHANMPTKFNDIYSSNENTIQECNGVAGNSESKLAESNDMCAWNTNVHKACFDKSTTDDMPLKSYITARNENVLLECIDIDVSTTNNNMPLDSNDTTARNENLPIECNDISTQNVKMSLEESNKITDWNENVVLECKDKSIKKDMPLESIDLSACSDTLLLECNDISTKSDNKALEPDDITTLNEIIYLDYNMDAQYDNMVDQLKGNVKPATDENMTSVSNDICERYESILLPEYISAKNKDVNVLSECNISAQNENLSQECNESNGWTENTYVQSSDENHKLYDLEVENENKCTDEEHETRHIFEKSQDESNTHLLGTNKSQPVYRTNNLNGSRTGDNIAYHLQCQPQYSHSYPDTTNKYQSQHPEEQNYILSNESETKNLSVNAELIDNSTLNLILTFPSTIDIETGKRISVDVDVDIDGHGELVHTSMQMLPISLTLEHADFGKENVPMVTTIISVKNTPIMNLNDKSEIIQLDSESVKLRLGMECKSHSEQGVKRHEKQASQHDISKQLLWLKQCHLHGAESMPKYRQRGDEVAQHVPRRCESSRPYNPQVMDNIHQVGEPQDGEVDTPNGAYTLNVFVVRQPGIELHVRSSSESSLI